MIRNVQGELTTTEECWRDRISLDVLYDWSDSTIAILAGLCFVTFIACQLPAYLIFSIQSVIFSYVGGDESLYSYSTFSRVKMEHVQKRVNISRVYQLEEVENYGEYLKAIDIQEMVASYIEKLK